MAAPVDPKVAEYLEAVYQDRLRGITPEARQAINRGELTEADLLRFYDAQQEKAAEGYTGWQQEFATKYPDLIWMLENPELETFMQSAIDNNWGPAEFQVQFQGTSWYRTRNEDQRNWQYLLKSEPMQAQRALERQTLTIRNMATSNGIKLGAGKAQKLARQALENGMTDEEVKVQLMGMVKSGEVAVGAGAFGGTTAQLRNMAYSYMLRISEKKLQKYAMNVFSGKTTLENIRESFIRQATNTYPWMADQLAGGITPRDFYAPLVGDVASLLELAPDSIDLMDPKWSPIVSVAGENGTRAPTRTEVEQWARSKPEWLKTRNGAASSAQMGQDILESFGAVST